MYVYVYIYIYIHTYIHIYIYICIYTHTLYIHMHLRVHNYTHPCIHVGAGGIGAGLWRGNSCLTRCVSAPSALPKAVVGLCDRCAHRCMCGKTCGMEGSTDTAQSAE